MPPVAVPVDVAQVVQGDTQTAESKSGKPIVGIIYPPPEIRNIVDKTASFVARNGAEFEARIRQHEINNPKFNFLSPADPYHTYYQHKVREFVEGKAVESSIPRPAAPVAPQKVQEAVKASEFVPKEPPPEFEFVADPATINAFDLDLIKLTAQFVARNGRQFLTQLMTREARNFQFDFLKPQHSNFAYFTKLVEQYTKILIPPKDIAHRLGREADNTKGLLESVRYRVEWGRYQKRLREREEAEAEKERIAYAQIDWHDFVVVQTVDFQPHESINLPPPCSPRDVGARLLAQQRIEAHKTASQTIEMEVESDSDEEAGGDAASSKKDAAPPGAGYNKEDQVGGAQRKATGPEADAAGQGQGVVIQSKPKAAYEVTQPVPAPPKPENVTVRKDYNPHNKPVEHTKAAEQKWVISPLTGEKIPADKLTEHMRYNTVDQQYFLQKEREMQDRQDEEPVYAPGTDISANIKAFAERRSDIFGVGSKGAEQTMIGKKLGEEDARRIDSKVIWDGHAASIEATAKAAQSHVSIEEQIAQIHRAQGLLPDEGKERIGPHVTETDELAATTASVVETVSPSTTVSQPVVVVAKPPPTTSASTAVPSRASYGLRSAPATMVPVVPVAQPMVIVQHPPLGTLYSATAPTGAVPSAMAFPGYNALAEDEPPAKRQKNLEDLLQPEDEWLKLYQERGPITVHVLTPVIHDKPEWKLNGQTINLVLSLADPVSMIKNRVQEITTMPASKQKLMYENIFIKDSLSLAYYNMLSGSIIQLQLKERGGRKK